MPFMAALIPAAVAGFSSAGIAGAETAALGTLTGGAAIGSVAGATALGTNILGAAGTLLSSAGALKAGSDANSAAEYNAKMLDTQAAQTRAYAKSSANQQAIVRSGQISGMRADYGSSGVETSGGSPLATLNENIRQSQLESMYTRLVANNDAVNLEQQANIARWNGKRANDAGWINAGSGLLAGVEQGVNQRLSLISGRF